jgi:hypothetical protein
MKEFMMITGCEILDNDWMELTLTPLTITKKQKIGLMDLATGDLSSLMAALPPKEHNSKMYMRIETWGNMNLCIGRHVSLELISDDTTGGIKI